MHHIFAHKENALLNILRFHSLIRARFTEFEGEIPFQPILFSTKIF